MRWLGLGLVLFGELGLCNVCPRFGKDCALSQSGNLRPVTGDKVINGDGQLGVLFCNGFCEHRLIAAAL